MIATLLLTFSARAADPPPDFAAQARQHSRAGALQLSLGGAAVGGGLVTLLVGRGEMGEISTESPAVHDLRSVGGAALLIGGFTGVLAGVNSLGRAAAARELAERPVSLAPTLGPDGGGLSLVGRF